MKFRRRLPLPRGPRDVMIWMGAFALIMGVVWLGYINGAGTFSAERAELMAKREAYTNALYKARDNRKERQVLDASLQAAVDRTLGSDLDAADSALRSRLNRIGEELRLTELRVMTERSTVRLSPAKAEFNRTGRQKSLRDEPDFIELPATIAGEGSAEQAYRLLQRLEVEPWLKRIESVRMEQFKDGERIRITIKLTTLFLPDRKGKGDLRPSESDLADFERYRAMALANPFRLPIPPKAAVAVAEPPVAPPPVAPLGFPYDQWLLTGLVDGPSGIEAWFRNGVTGEKIQIVPGQRVGEVTFTGSVGDLGEFSEGQQRFRVQIGAAMNARSPVS